MDRISVYNVNADLATLQTALSSPEIPAPLREGVTAMVAAISARAARAPLSIYVAGADDIAPLRGHFAYLLARALSKQIASTLLVDCDFLRVGMHGLVPEPDALGFLDLLLYGSSLGVITQESAGGVKVIGAGSFPVTKRMPFASGAFDEAAHRLVQHARCVLFVGPLHDDEGAIHPLCGAVDLPVLVRGLDAVRPGAVDPVEEQIATQFEAELLSARLVSPSSPVTSRGGFAELLGEDDDAGFEELEAPPPREPAAEPRAHDPLEDTAETPMEPPRHAPPPAPAPSRTQSPRGTSGDLSDLADPSFDDDGRHPTLRDAVIPRRRARRGPLFTIGVIVVVGVFLGTWWAMREEPEQTTGPSAGKRPPAQQLGERSGGSAEPAKDKAATAADNTGAAATVPDTAAAVTPSPVVGQTPGGEVPTNEPRRAELDDTGGRSGGTVLISPVDIHVLEEIQQNWPDHYFIHISSFRKSVEARSEVAFLESHEFPVFIVFLDLSAKGKWYRVYAGPFRDREQAREVKKSLDDIPSVRFTRITKLED